MGDLMEQNINQFVHQLVLQHIQPEHICLDATCGNGHDTVFLATHATHVHAVDIQPQAIESTQQKLATNQLHNVTLHLGSHDQLSSMIPTDIMFDVVMYNLGYLPHSDHNIITTSDTTVSSLQQAITLLNPGGLVTITLYIGHEGGLEESMAIESYLKTLDKHAFTIMTFRYLNRTNSPYVIALEKSK